MNTLEAIKTRRSIRDWTDQEVSDEQLIQILEAGRFAPSPLGSLAIGYAKDTPQPHTEKDRRPLSEMVFYEKYGKLDK